MKKSLLNKNIKKPIVRIYNNDIAAARVELYGHLRQMQSMQKAVQLTTFCVKSKLKYKCNFFLKKCYSISDISCIYGRYKNSILSKLF